MISGSERYNRKDTIIDDMEMLMMILVLVIPIAVVLNLIIGALFATVLFCIIALVRIYYEHKRLK